MLDIGANVGFHSLLFAQRVGPAGRVIAIEAHPRLAARVDEQLRLNGIGNVRLVNVAVTERAGEVTLYEGPRSNSGSTSIVASRGHSTSIIVPASPIMDILAANEIAAISLIKIDIEGAEGPVLRDVLDHLDQFPERLAVAAEVNPGDDQGWSMLFQRFLEAGFAAFALDHDYDWNHIDRVARSRPSRVTALPDGVCDILFYRGDDKLFE